MATSSSSTTPPLGKYLASTDKKTRDKAIKNLSLFFSDSSQNAITKADMTKLWKGIFYCFWMSDKPLVQQALASELAEITLTITSTPVALNFLRGFWETTVREWNGIDRLRIDKYYMLVRRFVNSAFRLLIREEWESSVCEEYNNILVTVGGPLCPTDIRVPSGLAYHLADIYVEELDNALSESSTPDCTLLPAPLGTVLTPFLALAAQTTTNTTYKRIQSALLDPLLTALSSTLRGGEEPSRKRMRFSDDSSPYPTLISNACLEDPTAEGKVDGAVLRKRVLRKVFDIASQPETRDYSRRRMYKLWKEDAAEDEDDSERD
ncbi:nucleolar protein,Nop52-domain-containing protein [Crucibulum laeve]|uniref:Nucleolar protein,Nop52-domain-containing protein n=1 Tax=Crucibulum laeve TaxID=68775 RepID=A0A5C3LW91_9AGAR|nr:nucleolar protein,Nop52-domain-containing protein [Crucibulum laeve]